MTLFGAMDSEWSVVEGTPQEQWRAARRNARLRAKRCNLTLGQLAERADLHPLERQALRLYAKRGWRSWGGGIHGKINARAARADGERYRRGAP